MLVVDDEVSVARALGRWLARYDLEVCVLTDSTRFAQELARVRPSVVVSDLVMPGVDGVALLLQSLALAPEVKRCLMSGSLNLVTTEQRASLAPCLFLDKPWDDATLKGLLALFEGNS